MAIPTTEDMKTTLEQGLEDSKGQLVALKDGALDMASSGFSGILMRDYVLNTPLTNEDRAYIAEIEALPADDPKRMVYEEAEASFQDIYDKSRATWARMGDVDMLVPKVALLTAHNYDAENSMMSEGTSWVKALVDVITSTLTGETKINGDVFAKLAQRQSEIGAEAFAQKALDADLPNEFAREQYIAKLEEDGRTPEAGDKFLASLDALASGHPDAPAVETMEPIQAEIIGREEIAERSAERAAFVGSAVMASVAESLKVAEGNSTTLATDEYRHNRAFASENELYQLFEIADTDGLAMEHIETNPLLKSYVEMRDAVEQKIAKRFTDVNLAVPMTDIASLRRETITEMLKHGDVPREDYTEIATIFTEAGAANYFPLLNNVNAVAAERYTVKEVLADANGYGAITHKIAADNNVSLEEARERIFDGDKDFFFTGNDGKEASEIALLTPDELKTYTAAAKENAKTMLANGVSEHPLYIALTEARSESLQDAEGYYSAYELQNTPNLAKGLLAMQEDGAPSDEQKAYLRELQANPLDENHLVDRNRLLSVAEAKIPRLSDEKLAELGVDGVKMPSEVQQRAWGVAVAEVQTLGDHGRADVLAAGLPPQTTDEEAIAAAKDAVSKAVQGGKRDLSDVIAGGFTAVSVRESGVARSRAKNAVSTEEVAPNADASPNREEAVEEAPAVEGAPVKVSALPPLMNPFGANGLEQIAMLKGGSVNPLTSVAAGVVNKATEHKNPETQPGQGTQIG